MLGKPGRSTWLAFALVAAGSTMSDAFGQGNTFNPYGNSGYRDYREFTQPMYSNEPSLPGQARLQGGGLAGGTSRANQFDAYSDSLEARESEAGGAASSVRSRPGVPYYRAFRQYDKDYQRVYTPNANADTKFAERLKQRGVDYNRAIEERDPTKRAALLRQLNQTSLDRPLPPPSRNAAKGTAAAKSAKSAVSSAVPTPPVRGNPARPDATKSAARKPATSPAPAASAPPGRANSTPARRPTTTPAPAASQPSAPEAAAVDPGEVPIPPPPR